MQISDKKKISAGTVTALLIVVLFLLGNEILSYILTPYRGSSLEMWLYFKEASPEMIYTGSSQCLGGIDPETIDDALHTSSFNMGTNMQSFRSSYSAIRAAVEEKGVSRVILCVDDEITGIEREDNFRADASFQRARNLTTDFMTAGKETGEFLLDEPVLMHTGSVNFFFPWTYDRVTDIGQNLREKRDDKVYGESGHRLSSGREPAEEILTADFRVIGREEAREWNLTSDSLEELSLSSDSRRELNRIASYCREKGVELIPITLPYPTALNIYSLDSYKETVRQLTLLFDEYGFTYQNFNLAKPEYYEMELDEYKDTGHFNTAGAIRFSKILAEYIEEPQEQRKEKFYTPDEF